MLEEYHLHPAHLDDVYSNAGRQDVRQPISGADWNGIEGAMIPTGCTKPVGNYLFVEAKDDPMIYNALTINATPEDTKRFLQSFTINRDQSR